MENICASQAKTPAPAPHRRQHFIVILPFLAPGHMIPTIPLAVWLASLPATTVSLASTPLNASRLATSLPPASLIRVHNLPFYPPDHGLPDGAENLDSVPENLHIHFFRSTSSLAPHLRLLLSDIQRQAPPGSRFLVLSDAIFRWTVEVAREFGARHAFLHTCGAFAVTAYVAVFKHIPQLRIRGTQEDQEFGLPGFPEGIRFRLDQLPEIMRLSDGTDEWSAFVCDQASINHPTDGHLINTVEELEPEGLRMHRETHKDFPVWPIGPLHLLVETSFSSSQQQRAGKKMGTSAAACVAWLDAHPPASVLYISFGSAYSINAAQMLSLATAIEATGVAFLWVVRPPVEFALEVGFQDDWLPQGFKDRVNATKQGLLVHSWAPQPEILSHPSVGAFLSHCGWNSTLEALSRGIPIIAWPLAADQYFNAKMLEEELGVCVVVARGAKETIDPEKLQAVVNQVVVGEKGEEMRRKAAEIAETIRAATVAKQERNGELKKGSSVQALEDFINFMLRG